LVENRQQVPNRCKSSSILSSLTALSVGAAAAEAAAAAQQQEQL